MHPDQKSHSQAAGAYGTTLAETNPRALEGRVLLKAAEKLEALAQRMKGGETVPYIDTIEVLEHNQKLWTVFVGETVNKEHPLPQEIKNNIASLGVFIFTRTRDLMIACSPERLKVLIDINRNIAAGLLKQAQNMPAPATAPAATAAPTAPVQRIETDSLA